MTRLRYNLRSIALISSLVLLTCPLVYAFYHQLYQKALQAEASLIFSYLHTLQKVYKLERGTYASFAYYGAPARGTDRCEQPLGAAQLGFLLHGCHDETSRSPHYAYRSVEAELKTYQLEAEAGSDGEGRSLVCFIPSGNEHLVSLQNSRLQLHESCW